MYAAGSSARALNKPPFYGLARRLSPRSKLRATARWLALLAIAQQIACGGKVSTTAVNADPAPVASVTISPSSAQISARGNVQFVATVQNASNQAVTWEVNAIPGGNSSLGTITTSGAATASYLAPASVPGTLTVTVAAVLQADGVTTGSATVTISPSPSAQISVSPPSASVVVGTSMQFSASVENGPQAVIWQVNNIDGGNAAVGTITSSGFYAAPAKIPNPATETITAILQTDLATLGTASITIIATPPPVVSVSPATANVPTGQTLPFSASVQNSNAGVIWEVNGLPGGNPAVGTIASSGIYTSPANPQSLPLTVAITAVLQTDSSISGSAGVTIVPPGSFTGVYSWRNDNSLTGQNPQETVLTPSNVNGTNGAQFGKLYGCPVDGQIYAQPLYVSNVTIPNQGTYDIVYVATENDSVYAFAAGSCQIIWQQSFINPSEGITTVQAIEIGSDDIEPEIGITGTPVIDPTTATIYVVAKTNENGTYKDKLHALDLATGGEKFGGPALIQPVANQGLLPVQEDQRAALSLAAGNVYVAFDSYGDTEPFHGWLFAYDAGNLTKAAVPVFNSTPNALGGGIGGSGAAPSSDGNGDIFVATSNGTFDGATGGDYAGTVLRLQINTGSASFNIEGTFTPWNEAVLQSAGTFGSTGVVLLPDSAGSSTHPRLAIAGSEAGSLYLLDRDNLGGFTSGGPDKVVQTLSLGTSSVFGTPAYWAVNGTVYVYVAAAYDVLRALPLTSGILNMPSCSASPTSCSTDTFPLFGASPVVSSNGASNGIVWALDNSGYAGAGGTSSPAILHAYDATNLANELYASPSGTNGPLPAAGPAVKFAVPTVANGMVFVGTQTELSVFGLP